jgi:hypothetical protein
VGFLVAVAITAMSEDASAQYGSLGIFSDMNGWGCMVDDVAPGFIATYVIHQNVGGATAVQFRVATEQGFTGVYSSHQEGSGFLGIGLPPEDYSVAYGGCIDGTFLVATIIYQGFGTSTACSHIEVAPAPTSPLPGEIVAADCNFQYLRLPAYRFLEVNHQEACPLCYVNAVEPSTWGRVKALYR